MKTRWAQSLCTVMACDAMGNRQSEQREVFTPSQSSTVSTGTFNGVNQLTSQNGPGPLPVQFKGKVNEAATVAVTASGQPAQNAQVSPDPDSATGGKLFKATLTLSSGTSPVTVVAEDFGAGNPPGSQHSGNTTTKNYSVTVAGSAARTLTYDANGNCTAKGSVGYEWDAEDRLVKITQLSTGNPQLDSEFTYDGCGRRVKIVEKNNGTVTSTKQFVWAGQQICQERDGNNNVTKRFYAEGQRNGSANYYYTRDHLGSIREVTDSSRNVQARYDYDPYGRVTKVSGSLATDFLYTGHYYHAPSGLHLALYRAYDADLGRWLNRDPIGEEGGLNLYGYVENDPINGVDPFGLAGTHPGASLQPEMFKHLMQEALEQAAEELGIPVPQLMNTKNLWDKMIRKGVLNPKNWDLSDFHKLLDRAKGAKKCSDDMLHDLLKTGGNRGDLHKKKEKILNQFRKVLQDSDNPDVFPDAAGKVVIRSRDGKVLIPTGKTFEELLPDLLK